jgi:protein involved in polysaccharide export with SLBB domain
MRRDYSRVRSVGWRCGTRAWGVGLQRYYGACVLFVAWCCLVPPVPSMAQETDQTVRGSMRDRGIDLGSHVLQPRDQLLVTVLGKLSFSYVTAVTADGNLAVSLPGPPAESRELLTPSPTSELELLALELHPISVVPVSGLTLADGARVLEEKFRTYLQDPQVQLTLVQMGRFRETSVYVTGEVAAPGPYDYYPGMTVGDYLGVAGGPTSRARLKQMKVVRPNGVEIDAEVTTEVERGDRIVVPRVALQWWTDYVTIATAVTALILSWMAIAK